MDREAKSVEVLERLDGEYEAATALNFTNELELLVATILSAQCTDVRVNKVTEELFEKYTCPEDYAEADLEELGEDIRSTGFYNQKAKYIKGACRAIVEEHGGEVPSAMEELTELHGVGRKTANVVSSEAFGTNEGIAVDTHVGRISRRLGLTEKKGADAAEKELMEVVPRERWWDFNNLLVEYGRDVCSSRNPSCDDCRLDDLCENPENR